MTQAADAGRYQVLGQLATGGMGEILLARRRGPGGFERLVVLKRPLATSHASRDLAAALIEEARLLAQIDHANVCRLHDLEEADGQYFLALELLEGLPLWTILACARNSRRPIDPRAICGMFEQICDGLEAIHQLRMPDGTPAGVVHRDLSPGNLFVTESGTVKILDLGIAKTAASEDLTPFGTIKGKLPYLAPEQAAGRPVTARADLFSLGLVLYDTARGSTPPSDRIGALASDELELDAIPPVLAEVITRAVRRDPAERFGSAAEIAAAIRAASQALGGSLGRAELAEWLAREFAHELEAQRARTRDAIAGGTKPTVTRTLTLRSALLRSMTVDDVDDVHDVDDITDADGGRDTPAIGARFARSSGAALPPHHKRATERLPAENDPPPADAAPPHAHRTRATERLPTQDSAPPADASAPYTRALQLAEEQAPPVAPAAYAPAQYAPAATPAPSAPAPYVAVRYSPVPYAPTATSSPHVPALHAAAQYAPAQYAPAQYAPVRYSPVPYAAMATPAPHGPAPYAPVPQSLADIPVPHVPVPHSLADTPVAYAPARYAAAVIAVPPRRRRAVLALAAGAVLAAAAIVVVVLAPAPAAPAAAHSAASGPAGGLAMAAPAASEPVRPVAAAPATLDATRPAEAVPSAAGTARADSPPDTGPDDAAPPRSSMPTAPSTSVARSAPPPRSDASPPHRNTPRPRLATSVQPAAAPGLLTIGSMPWADIWIGDRKLRTDVWRAELPAGRYTLRARTGDGREQTKTFTLESGKENRIVLNWSAP